MNIGKQIQELRKQNNITQEELAAPLGVTAAAVSKWENGYTLPDILMLCALADFFDVTTDELLGRTASTKEAIVVATDPTLSDKIKRAVESYGFTVVQLFSAYQPALSYALTHENCKNIFTGGARELISAEEIEATPTEINSMHFIGNGDGDILQGIKELCSNIHLLDI